MLVSGGFAVMAVLALILFTSLIKDKAVRDLAREDARQTSQLVFESLYSAMRKGWTKDEITEIIGRLNLMLPDMKIQVYRGAPVIRQFGEVPGEREAIERDADLRRILQDGGELLTNSGENIRFIFPVIVERECLRCHALAQVGDVNGAVDIEFPVRDLKVSLDFVMNVVIGYFVLLVLVLLLVLLVKLRYLVVNPLMKLVHGIRDISTSGDLDRRLEVDAKIEEVVRLTEQFNHLLARLQEHNHQLEKLTDQDVLTGLLNRESFLRYAGSAVEQTLKSDSSCCLVLLDLDNFKQLNDTHGHPIGDLVLARVAEVLTNHLRPGDLLARLGGDEFALLLPDTSPNLAAQLVERWRQMLGATDIELPTGPTRILASFGLVSCPDGGQTIEDLFAGMDLAMYQAKRAGKNRVVAFHPDDKEGLREVYRQSEEIRRSLIEDRIEVVYQPIRNLATGRLAGLEALARVRHGRALVDAAQFIHVADQVGLIEEVDLNVFNSILKHKKHSALRGIPIFINLSGRTLTNQSRLRFMMERVRENNLRSGDLVIEMNEREALPHIGMLRILTAELSGSGIGVALDDFGSGFSSFLNLKYLHVDYVKIEGSFMRNLAIDEQNRVMVEHLNQIVSDFKITSIAKQIEDASTAELVESLGIALGQGFHIGSPVEFEAVLELAMKG